MDCPFINSNSPLCSENLNIQHLEEAYQLCAEHFLDCPFYQQLSRGELQTVGVAEKDSYNENYLKRVSVG